MSNDSLSLILWKLSKIDTMKKRYIIPLLLLLLLFIGGYWFYNFLQNNSGINSEAMNLVPKDAVFIVETDEPIENWKKISDSEPWKYLMKNKYYKDINNSAEELNKILEDNESVFGDFGSRKVVMSAHVYKPSDFDFLYIVDLQNISKVKPLIEQILEGLNGFKVSKRTHKEHEVFALANLKTKSTLYITFVDNLLVCSYTNSLVEKSINQKDEPVIPRDRSFIEVEKVVRNEGMLRLYINYEYFDDYMRVYTKSNEKYVKALSESLRYSGLHFDYDKSNTMLKFIGHSTLTPEKETYLQLLQTIGGSKMGFAPYVSKRAGIVTALNVNNFQDFYAGLEGHLKKDVKEFEDYQMKIKKIEKFLKISVKDHFLSWIDDELTFVNTSPIGLGAENEYALFIKAKSGSEAKEKLGFIGKQIKRRTPVKFKGVDYKGYTINFLSVKGLFKLMMGDFFGKIDKPYYTIIDDYVIFSNHPQTIKNIINDYIAKETLENSDQFRQFEQSLNSENSMLIYVNTPIAQKTLKNFLDKEAQSDISKNQQYFESFPNIAFQLTSKGDGFDTRILVDYRDLPEVKEMKKDVEIDKKEKVSTGNSSSLTGIQESGDSVQLSIQSIEEAALLNIEEMILDDLDAKIQEEKYENGEVKLEVGIKNGFRHGIYTEYSETGEVIVKGSFKNDQKSGIWKFYDAQGNLISKKRY